MSKVTLNHMFASASGKLCKKEGTYVAYNKKTGKMYTAEYHGAEQPNSAAQQAAKTLFAQKTQVSAQWWRENKASSSEAYLAVMKAYKAQSKIGNPYSFLRSLVTDDLKVILSGKDITGGIVPNTPGTNPGGTTGGSGEMEG